MPPLKHLAIIMDGNGRWARKRGLPRVVGHRQGVESVRTMVKASQEFGIKYLTLYTFSTENWERPAHEVNTLMNMLEEMLHKEMQELHKNNVQIKAIGRIELLHAPAQQALEKARTLTCNNDGLILTLCLSYGGRSEIVDAVKKIIEQERKKSIPLERIDEAFIYGHLYDPSLPEPDLLIRTGSENRERISNFLLWQIAYTEIYFTATLWPDFSKQELQKAIESFKKRERLFGSVQRTEK